MSLDIRDSIVSIERSFSRDLGMMMQPESEVIDLGGRLLKTFLAYLVKNTLYETVANHSLIYLVSLTERKDSNWLDDLLRRHYFITRLKILSF